MERSGTVALIGMPHIAEAFFVPRFSHCYCEALLDSSVPHIGIDLALLATCYMPAFRKRTIQFIQLCMLSILRMVMHIALFLLLPASNVGTRCGF